MLLLWLQEFNLNFILQQQGPELGRGGKGTVWGRHEGKGAFVLRL